jgi:hypothetical protein
MADEEFVSLNPETFTEGGGGLVNDVDGEFTNFKFMSINPSSRELIAGDVPYLIADFTTEDETYGMRWSTGGAANWEVGASGKSLKSKGAQKGVNKGSNLGLFLTSLYNSGFPKDKLGNDIEILNGLQAHIIRIPEPERKGLQRAPRTDGREGPGIVTISKINRLPWDKAAAKGKGKAAAAGSKAPAANDALESEVVGIILTSLADNPEGIAKKDVIKAVVAQATGENRGAAMQLANNDTWLKGRTEWAYENGVIRLP